MSVISSRRRPSVRRLLLGHPLRVLWDSSLRESARHPSTGWLPCTNDREVTPNSVSLVGLCRIALKRESHARAPRYRGLGDWLVK